ncbi:uncharacterized protein LOC113210453 [Frankliniella occidentalis]|uniref:Uncharacterized protein LOC113210453 n=1 Tax=Frankliniella occidentalis TaxID=133901 RepID=A0A6J1SSI3_FRAOC|nr:uncharacterized protein LOC113210453 [Frankliniella occidentalis]
MAGEGSVRLSLLSDSMLYAIVALVALLHQPVTQGKAITPFAGPWFAWTEKFSVCEGQYPWSWNIKTTPYNPQKHELQLISGNVTGDKTIDDNFWLKVVMDLRSKNQWSNKGLTFEFKNKACTAVVSNIPGFYSLFFGKEKKPCSIDPGVYRVDQEPIDWNFPNFPIVPYGHYKFRIMSGIGNDMAVCLINEVHLIPKPTT